MLKQQTHPSGFAGMRVNGASRSAAAAAQNEVASDIRSSGGHISYRYSLINAIAAGSLSKVLM